jgi:hypothetical protein
VLFHQKLKQLFEFQLLLIDILHVFKSFCSVQEVPFQDSVTATNFVENLHQKLKLLFEFLLLLKPYLAVFKSFTSVQLVPFQDSVCAVLMVKAGFSPPKAKAAV